MASRRRPRWRAMLTAVVMPRLLKLPVGSCDSSLMRRRFSPSAAPRRGQGKSGRAGWNVYRVRQNDRAVANSYAVLEALDRLLLTMQDAETGQRGYLLTGRQDYLQPYRDAVRHVHDRLAAVRALLPADEGP